MPRCHVLNSNCSFKVCHNKAISTFHCAIFYMYLKSWFSYAAAQISLSPFGVRDCGGSDSREYRCMNIKSRIYEILF